MNDTLKTRRLTGIFLLGWVLMNYPVLSLFNRAILFMGIPLLYLYIFSVWLLLILLVVLSTRTGLSPQIHQL